MNIIDMAEFVKSQSDFQKRLATKFAQDAKRSSMHTNSASKFDEVAILLDDLARRLDNNPNFLSESPEKNPSRISLSWDEVQDLPPELLQELSISESDKQEFAIRSMIADLGGVASLDRILVQLFKQTGEIAKRAQLNQKLYRMVQKEMVYSVPGKKGVYSIAPLSDEDAEKLI